MRDAFPKHPNVYTSDEETQINCADLYNEWRGRLQEDVERTINKLGWSYQIGATSLSRTHEFVIIFRAKIKYILREGEYEEVKVLWQNAKGLNGSVSAPIEALSYDKPQKFSFSGSSKHLIEPPVSEEFWVEVDVANDLDD